MNKRIQLNLPPVISVHSAVICWNKRESYLRVCDELRNERQWINTTSDTAEMLENIAIKLFGAFVLRKFRRRKG